MRNINKSRPMGNFSTDSNADKWGENTCKPTSSFVIQKPFPFSVLVLAILLLTLKKTYFNSVKHL